MIYANIKPEKLIKFSPARAGDKTLVDEGVFYGHKWICEREVGDNKYYHFTFFADGEWSGVLRMDSQETINGYAYRCMKNILNARHGHEY